MKDRQISPKPKGIIHFSLSISNINIRAIKRRKYSFTEVARDIFGNKLERLEGEQRRSAYFAKVRFSHQIKILQRFQANEIRAVDKCMKKFSTPNMLRLWSKSCKNMYSTVEPWILSWERFSNRWLLQWLQLPQPLLAEEKVSSESKSLLQE